MRQTNFRRETTKKPIKWGKIQAVGVTSREVGVNLKNGYNGELTSKQAGSVGGQMVKKMSPARTIRFTRGDRTAAGHEAVVTYIVEVDT